MVTMQDSHAGHGHATGQPRHFVLGPPRPQPAESFVPDAQQERVLAHRGQPGQGSALLVVGGPGTGKTSLLVADVVARAADGDLTAHLVLTWSRPAAQELRSRLVRAVGRTQVAPKVMTVHGFCHALVRRFAAAGPTGQGGDGLRLLTAPEQEFRVRELLAGHDTSRWPQDLVEAAGTRAFATEMRAVLARARQLAMDPAEVSEAGRRAGRPEWQAVGGFFDDYLDVLDAEGAMDYAELVHRTRLLLLEPGVREALAGELASVHVDEFAECDRSQVSLLADLAGLGLDVVAFADPSTAVFAFRGAELRSVVNFQAFFTRPGVATERIELSNDHRCSVEVSRAAALVAAKLPRNGAPDHPRPLPSAVRGAVHVTTHEDTTALVEHTADILRQARRQGLDWSQMAVMTRSGRGDLPVLARGLDSAGIPVEVAGDEIALASELAVRPLLQALETAASLVNGQRPEDEVLVELLRSPLGGLDALGLRRLGRMLRAREHARAHAAASERDLGDDPAGIETGGEGLSTTSTALVARLVLDPGSASALVSEDRLPPEVRQTAALGRLLDQVAGVVARGGSAQVALWQLWSGTSWPGQLEATALAGGEDAARAHRDLDAVGALFDLAARESQMVGQKGVQALVAEVAGQAIPADTHRESELRDRGVRLVTAHRAKGEQWPLVVVVGVQDGSWPNLTRRGSLLEPDRLSVDGVLAPTPTSQVLAEERRLFLLACSRASDHLVVSAVASDQPDGAQPSRFLRDLGVQVHHIDAAGRRSGTLPALVAHLRQVATDPSRSGALREAAAERLARLAETRDRSGRPLVPQANPSRWWGVLDYSRPDAPLVADGQPIVLSGSQVESLLDCPRQWFLARQARAEAQRGSAASVGSVVHVLAQHSEAEHTDLEQMREQLEAVWPDLPFDAQWLQLAEREEAEAALERFAAWQQAMASRTVLGVEVDFRVPVEVGGETVELHGSVDRLELDEQGRLFIVDFKTGRSVPSQKEVDRMDQLGIYQLAAQEGAFEHLAPGERRVGGAELVYLRKQDGKTPFPKVVGQSSLDELPHGERGAPAPEPGPDGPTWVHEDLATAARTIREERFWATPCQRCSYCPFAASCPATSPVEEVGR